MTTTQTVAVDAGALAAMMAAYEAHVAAKATYDETRDAHSSFTDNAPCGRRTPEQQQTLDGLYLVCRQALFASGDATAAWHEAARAFAETVQREQT
jgi:hypothetical protein